MQEFMMSKRRSHKVIHLPLSVYQSSTLCNPDKEPPRCCNWERSSTSFEIFATHMQPTAHALMTRLRCTLHQNQEKLIQGNSHFILKICDVLMKQKVQYLWFWKHAEISCRLTSKMSSLLIFYCIKFYV